MDDQPRREALTEPERRRTFGLLFCVVAITASGTQAMQSVMPAIGREIGLADPMIAAVFSLSALLGALSATPWAWASDRWGRKPIIITGLAGFVICSLLFGASILVGLRHLLATGAVFVLMMLTRGIFGLVASAASPAAHAYIADNTTREARTRALSTQASAFGLGSIIGPATGPFLILPVLGLSGPVFAYGGLALLALAIVLARLREPGEPVVRHAAPAPADGKSIWRRGALLPFLVFSFLLNSALVMSAQVIGFRVIDMFGRPPAEVQHYTGAAMMIGAISGVAAQLMIARFFRPDPKTLMRLGAAIGGGGALVMMLVGGFTAMVVGFAVLCLGSGLARPGAMAGLSLASSDREQGMAAGAMAAIGGGSMVLAPMVGVSLYGAGFWVPHALSAAILLGLLCYAWIDRALRSATVRRDGGPG